MSLKVFLSYKRSAETNTWAGRAEALLRGLYSFEVFNYKTRGTLDPNLTVSLQDEIKGSDVVICVLDDAYLNEELTMSELNCAVTLASGDVGNLRDQKQCPIVYLLCVSDYASKWCMKSHPGFNFQSFLDFQFNEQREPLNPPLWDWWKQNVEDRVSKLQAPVPPGGKDLILLGRPFGKFADETQSSVASLMDAAHESSLALIKLDDGWAVEPKLPQSRTVIDTSMGARTVTIQVCDEDIWETNNASRRPGEPVADELRKYFSRSGLDQARIANSLSRTVFWKPCGLVMGEPASDRRDIGAGPIFSTEAVDDLIACIGGGSKVNVRAKPGIDDVAPVLFQGLEATLGSLLFALWSEQQLEESIYQALLEERPLLVAIHDRLPITERPFEALNRAAAACDTCIASAIERLEFRPRRPVVRAAFLLRHPTLANQALVREDTWHLLPVKRDERGLRFDESSRGLESVKTALQNAQSA